MKPVPPHLTQRVMEFAEVELSPRQTLLRFYLGLGIGALITLLFCPQFGIGPIGGGHGISHWVMPYGAVACGAFCAAVFVGLGTWLGAFILTRAQWRWIWQQHYFIVLPPVIFLFILLMSIKTIGGLNGMDESLTFYMAWIMTALIIGSVFLKTIKILRPI